MIPLQYINTEELDWAFRVPHPLRVSKGVGLDSTATGIAELEGAEKPHPCKRRKDGAPYHLCSYIYEVTIIIP
jgi:hypothetical protein